jgi:hypothetical protein
MEKLEALDNLVIEYIVKRTGAPGEATIEKEGKIIGDIHPISGLFVVVDRTSRKTFKLTPRVDGEVRPFSMIAYETTDDDQEYGNRISGREVLKIKNKLFWHNGNIYLMNSVPEGSLPREHITGSRFISKLVNFPYSSDQEIDPETWERLGRHRGQQVGELSGLGRVDGHKVKLASELEDIGVPLAAASYLIYSTG